MKYLILLAVFFVGCTDNFNLSKSKRPIIVVSACPDCMQPNITVRTADEFYFTLTGRAWTSDYKKGDTLK